MKYTTAILSSLMASAAVAQPHIRHQHAARHEKHEKRDVVWVTETKVVTQVVDMTTTVWVPAGPTSAAVSSVEAAPSTLSKSVVAAASSSVSEGGAFNEAPSSSSVAAPSSSSIAAPSSSSVAAPSSSVTPTTSSTPVASVAPTTSSTSSVVIPSTTSSSSSVSVAPTTSSSSSSVYVAPPSSTSSSTSAQTQAAISISVPVVVPAASSSSSVAAAPTTRSVSTGVSAGASVSICSAGSPCTGDITFYDAGLGSCGETTDGDKEPVIALPWELMGTQSNGNPYCGLTVTISYKGKTVVAKIVDKCMGCTGKSIDLSKAAFDALASEDVGRTSADWWFN